MRSTLLWLEAVLFSILAAAAALAQAPTPAQSTTSQGPTAPIGSSPRVQEQATANEPKPPDMACFGYYPNWSVQFTNGEARYLGVNEPDQHFAGRFHWVPEEDAWDWHRVEKPGAKNTNSGNNDLSAWITKSACNDPVLKESLPYSAQVYLPQGDMVSGCCRKLKPREAPVGPRGVPPTEAGPNPPAPTQHQQIR